MEGLQAISRPGSQTVHHRSALLYDLVISSFSDATSYGSTSPPIRPPNGSPTRSPRPSLGSGTPIPHPGPRRLVRPCRNATSRCHGHSGPTNRAAIALAEWTRRTTHRLDPARVPGPCRGPGRRAPAPDPRHLCQLLQRTPNSPISDQGHPAPARGRASRQRHITTDPRRPSPSILQNLIFGTDRRSRPGHAFACMRRSGDVHAVRS